MVPDDAGKPAATRWRRIAGWRAEPGRVPALVGRTHQVRVHAARGLGAAIVGDPVYSLPDDAELGG